MIEESTIVREIFKRRRSLIRRMPIGRIPVQVVAMVERVVKRQADLGVDIVTDGEVAFFEGMQWNCQVELLLGWQRGILHALSEARRAGD